MNAFIIEDNGINRVSLETILEDNSYHIIGSFSNAEEAWESLKNLKPDIILIDINLAGDKDGIWLGLKIRENLDLPFIFLTAYGDSETIERVKHTKPNGYLMKPYNEPTLLTTISIAIESFKNKEKTIKQSLYIKDNYIRVKLDTLDILYIQSEGNYLEIFLENKKHLIRSRLADFLLQLPNNNFVQIHRRYVVNISKIDLLGNDFVKINNIELPVSKTFKVNLEIKLNL